MSEQTFRTWLSWRALGQVVLAFLDVYGLLLLAYLLISALIGDQFWLVAMVDNIIHWLLLPMFVLLPLALWRRRWPTVVMFGISALAFVVLFGALFLPHSVPVYDPANVLTVMTHNLQVASTAPDDLVALIRESDADIIGLQEVSEEHAEVIAEALSDLYPYQALYGLGIPGKGLLSRYPIVEEELFSRLGDRLPQLRVELDVDGVRLIVLVAHPPPPTAGRTYSINPEYVAEVTMLVQMTDTNAPVILLGDFNTSDQSDSYHLLADAGLTDTFRSVGWGFGATWPTRLAGISVPPLARIDYIWHTAHFQTVSAWVGPDAGSDHLPVLAELVWTTEN